METPEVGYYAKLIFLGGWIALTGAVSAAPVIFCAQAEWDFGTIPDAASVTNRFLIENRGDSSLLITDVETSCGCTAATLPEQKLAPGGRMPLTVVFNPAKRSGKQHKGVYIHSNDPKTPVFQLQLAGRVRPQVVVLPSVILFVAHSSDKRVERTLTLTYDHPVKIVTIDTGSDAVTAKSTASASATSYLIELKIDPKKVNERFRTELQIKTDDPSVPVQKVPISGRVIK